MNHIFGCPMHYGVGAPGLINSLDYLQSFCPELDIDILPEITRPEENLSNPKYLNSVIASCSQIAESGYHALCKGESPLYITGDHSSAIGSVSAARNILRRSWSDLDRCTSRHQYRQNHCHR